MKKRTIVFTGHTVSAALLAFGKSIQAQFRNRHLVDGAEPCDYVAGDAVPDAYADVPMHPEWPEDGEAGLTDATLPTPGTKKPLEPSEELTGDGSGDTLDEIEITRVYLSGLNPKQLQELAAQEGVKLTKKQKADVEAMIEAIANFFDI